MEPKKIADSIFTFYRSCDKTIFFAVSLSVVIITISFVVILAKRVELPSQIPLFYSNPWGEPQLAANTQLFVLPLICTLSLLANILAGWYLHDSQIVLRRILSLSCLVVCLLILTTIVRIIGIFV